MPPLTLLSKRVPPLGVCLLLSALAACIEHAPPPTRPSTTLTSLQPPAPPPMPSPTTLSLEGEPGSGDGYVVQRSRASGGQTIHLAPGERRAWTFSINAASATYALSLTYANGREGPNEFIKVMVDGTTVREFRNRDSGDAIEGWNTFVTDPAGTSALGSGSHTLVIESSGGDGCVEIDFVTLSPTVAGT